MTQRESIAHDAYWASPAFVDVDIVDTARLTLGEGGTPVEQLCDDARILLKREDRNPSGSHKDRAAAFQLAAAASRGDSAVTISSSGNAAIATSRYAALHRLPAIVFVHPTTDPAKLAAIDGATTIVVRTPRAINGAKRLARDRGIPNLRPSTSDDAIAGYRSLGHEIAAVDCDTVVLFVTSGATGVAVAEVLRELRPEIQLHVVQGAGNAALVDPSASVDDSTAHNAAAGRLGVRRSRRGSALRSLVEATGGTGHVVAAEDVAAEQARGAVPNLSDESAANLVVARRLVDTGRRPLCVISGAPPQSTGTPRAVIDASDEFDALAQVGELLRDDAEGAT